MKVFCNHQCTFASPLLNYSTVTIYNPNQENIFKDNFRSG